MGKLTLKQQNFVNNYLETGNATESAARAYNAKNRNTAHSIGTENLQKPAIKDYLKEKAEDAILIIYKLAKEAKSENVRLNACKDILDRAGYFVDKSEKADELKQNPIPLIPIYGGLSRNNENN